jgi:hypothetical protein
VIQIDGTALENVGRSPPLSRESNVRKGSQNEETHSAPVWGAQWSLCAMKHDIRDTENPPRDGDHGTGAEKDPRLEGQEEDTASDAGKQGNPPPPRGRKGGKRKGNGSGGNGFDPYPHGEQERGEHIASYFYNLSNGEPYLLVKRFERTDENGKKWKSFPQYHFQRSEVIQSPAIPPHLNERNWLPDPPNGPKIPYYLPDLVKAPKDALVFIPEGERDAESIFDCGLIATTSSGGATKDGWTSDLNQWFEDRICIVPRDNDAPGKRFARRKMHALRSVAKRVVGIDFGKYKDVTAYLEATYGADYHSNPEAKADLLRRAQFALALDELANTPPDQFESAKEAFCKEWKIGKRNLNTQLKEYDAERRSEDREATEDDAPETDEQGRKRIPAPAKDAEKTAVMQQLDEILTTDEIEPPMRDLSKIPLPVEVTMCEPINMHLLESVGANSEEENGYTRLPPPKTHMLTKHDTHSLALLIERHAQFYKIAVDRDGNEIEVPVAIHDCFMQAYLVYRYSNLPRVGMILTMPLVLPNGELLAKNGLDKRRKIVFRIEPDILKLLPVGIPDDQAIKVAITFLVDEWLCDVLMPFAHKCIIIALALSILERALIPDRPGFIVSAGKRGGGKTTLLHMIALAISGARAAATAWANSEEERAKAIFSLLLQGVPFVVFDNIPRGTTISSPTIEKIATATEYTDRVLGASRNETVSCATIFCWTGNHIYGKGETASRVLNACVEVNQPDPENRPFKHPDPMKWTLDHRGEILAAFYTIMLGNPRLRQPEKERPQLKTRFKDWQHLVGSSIEYAAGLYGESIDFADMFLSGEADDEETSDMAELLRILDRRFPDKKRFKGGDVKRFLEDERDTADAIALKGFLSFGGKNDEIIPGSKTISAKLTVNTNAPTTVDGRIFTLKRDKEKDATGTYWFWVERPDPDEEDM